MNSPEVTPRTRHANGRSEIGYAFGGTSEGEAQQELMALRDASRATFVRYGEELVPTDETSDVIRGQNLYVLPAYNEGIIDKETGRAPIQAVLDYLRAYEVRPDLITVMNCSDRPDDRTTEIAASYGIKAVQQPNVIQDLVDRDKFLDLIQAERIRAGKGLTLTMAYAHLYASGQLHEGNEQDMHVVSLDTDPTDYGIGKYDPLLPFARMRLHHGAQSMKPSKSRRGNQAVYVGHNAASVTGKWSSDALHHLGKIQWGLSGEMSRAGFAMNHLSMHTGYPVGTTMNLSDWEQGLKFMQYADGPLRSDGNNPLEKETVMYTQIGRTRNAVQTYMNAQIAAMLAKRTGGAVSAGGILKAICTTDWKRLIDFGVDDVRTVNEMLAQFNPTYVPDETNPVPENSVAVEIPFEHRLLGTIQMLTRERILRIG